MTETLSAERVNEERLNEERLNEERLNIVGMVINANPSKQTRLQQSLNALSGIEIHASEPGRLIVTIDEDECQSSLFDTITQLNNTSGVLSTSIAYHYFADQANFAGDLSHQEKQL